MLRHSVLFSYVRNLIFLCLPPLSLPRPPLPQYIAGLQQAIPHTSLELSGKGSLILGSWWVRVVIVTLFCN